MVKIPGWGVALSRHVEVFLRWDPPVEPEGDDLTVRVYLSDSSMVGVVGQTEKERVEKDSK